MLVTQGTGSPFVALHKSGSYQGVICRAFSIARPVSFDPNGTQGQREEQTIGAPQHTTGARLRVGQFRVLSLRSFD